MRIIDYREFNPEIAMRYVREEAYDALCDAITEGEAADPETFVSDYVNDYMFGVFTDDMEDAHQRCLKLAEREEELLAAIETVMSGPGAMVGGELSPGARHDVNYYRAQLAEVHARHWDAYEEFAPEL